MCGIAGAISMAANPAPIDFVAEVVRSQVRRGPDHQAVQVVLAGQSDVVFGHDRLSILDLSHDADQPFWSADGRYCVTFNGEIYNYRELRRVLQHRGRALRTQS